MCANTLFGVQVADNRALLAGMQGISRLSCMLLPEIRDRHAEYRDLGMCRTGKVWGCVSILQCPSSAHTAFCTYHTRTAQVFFH